MSLVTAEVTWLRWLLEDFGVYISVPTSLLSDSTEVISIPGSRSIYVFRENG
jgi:hypothetical protein